jgi:hypothetical protein
MHVREFTVGSRFRLTSNALQDAALGLLELGILSDAATGENDGAT